jgi:hypothetical protein
MRLWGQYIKAESNTFEYDFFSVFRLWVYLEYLSNASATFEFGCGSGCNLPVLAELFPEKELHGLDWVRSSVDIVNEMRSQYGWNMTGHLFDLFNPDYSLAIDDNSEFITFGALEQLGANYKEFVEFTINKKPVLCVHIEPLYELYNPNSLLDYFARKYHKKRGYLDNFLSYLEGEDRVKIIEWERMDFGGLFQDGWSRVVWQPIEEER